MLITTHLFCEPQLVDVSPDPSERRLGRLLHHLLDVACQLHRTLAPHLKKDNRKQDGKQYDIGLTRDLKKEQTEWCESVVRAD